MLLIIVSNNIDEMAFTSGNSRSLGRMIRKTLYLCVGVVAAALMSINACSSNVQANTNESELERIAHERELEAQREQKSVWETDLADESRFTLNLKT